MLIYYLKDIYTLFSQKLGSSFDKDCFYVRETGLTLWEKFGEEYWNIYPRKAVEHFLSLQNPPTAIVAPYPLLSRIHKHLLNMNIQVPQDISLASMNYSSEKSVHTDFTRIVYDETQMLCWGADRLLAKLADYSQGTASFFQKPVFIAGETACPPSRKTN